MRSGWPAVALLVAALSGGCVEGEGPGVERLFEVSEHDGGPLLGGEVHCEGIHANEESWVIGVVEQRGATSYACLMPEQFGIMYYEVARPNRITGARNNRAPLRMWDPAVSLEVVDDQLVVAWDRPAPEVPIEPGWEVRQSLWSPGVGTFELDGTVTEIELPLAPFTAADPPELKLSAYVEGPDFESMFHEVLIPVTLPAPVLPAP